MTTKGGKIMMQKIKYCSHVNSGDKAVLFTNCGGCYCPICNQVWPVRKEEIEEMVNKLCNQMRLKGYPDDILNDLKQLLNSPTTPTDFEYFNRMRDALNSMMSWEEVLKMFSK